MTYQALRRGIRSAEWGDRTTGIVDLDTISYLKTIRLERLADVAQCVSQEVADHTLLNLCLSKHLRVYFPVRAGHVVAVYENAAVERRVNFPSAMPVVLHHGRATIRHEIRWICVDENSIKQIRDANIVVLEGHFEGGLVQTQDGYLYCQLDYCVIRRDLPTLLSPYPEFRPQTLTEGVVFPTKQEIRFSDLSVSRDDADLLRKAVGPSEIDDKWGHKQSAPNIYRLYTLSQEPYNEAEFARRLIASDDSGVFIQAIAKTAARILKKDVRTHAEERLCIAKISDNEMGRDYSDTTLSKRMSLLLLATDCWLHDKALLEEAAQTLQSIRNSVKRARETQAGTRELRILETQLVEAEMDGRSQLLSRLLMPNGLVPYLEGLGFSSNQATQLARVIKGQKVGGVHPQTKKASTIKR